MLTYRGRAYPFGITGLSFGITAGVTVGRLEGWASGIREVSDFAGTYSSVGGGFALVGGVSGVHLRNEKGVTIVMQGPKAGLESRGQRQSDHDLAAIVRVGCRRRRNESDGSDMMTRIAPREPTSSNSSCGTLIAAQSNYPTRI